MQKIELVFVGLIQGETKLQLGVRDKLEHTANIDYSQFRTATAVTANLWLSVTKVCFSAATVSHPRISYHCIKSAGGMNH